MGRRVDPVGEARDDDDPGPRQARGDEPGRLEAGAGRAPGSDEGDDRCVSERPAADEEDGRRVGRLPQEGRVLRVADRDDARPGALEPPTGLVESRGRRRVEERRAPPGGSAPARRGRLRGRTREARSRPSPRRGGAARGRGPARRARGGPTRGRYRKASAGTASCVRALTIMPVSVRHRRRVLATGLVLSLVVSLSGCASTPKAAANAADQKAYGAKMAQQGFWREALFRFERADEARSGRPRDPEQPRGRLRGGRRDGPGARRLQARPRAPPRRRQDQAQLRPLRRVLHLAAARVRPHDDTEVRRPAAFLAALVLLVGSRPARSSPAPPR